MKGGNCSISNFKNGMTGREGFVDLTQFVVRKHACSSCICMLVAFNKLGAKHYSYWPWEAYYKVDIAESVCR